MFLTDEETLMLNGNKGPAVQKAMQILVALGESFGAERLVEVNNVHMAGSSVLVAEEAGTRFVEDIRKQGGDCRAHFLRGLCSMDSADVMLD